MKNQAKQATRSNTLQNLQILSGHSHPSDNKFESFIQSFQTFINSVSHNFSESQHKQSQSGYQSSWNHENDFEYRDRLVFIDLPSFQNGKVELSKLSSWIGAVCKQIFSVAFNFYCSKKLNYDQMKVFASESLLRNIAILVGTYNITKEELKFVDKKMQEYIYPYFKAKYPMTSEKQSCKALQKAVKQIDNSQALANDYFSQTDIRFPYRQNGRYGDLIMQLLNELISKLDVKNKQSNTNGFITTFKDFENKMTQIFQKSYDENWMNYGGQSSNDYSAKSQIQKEKYRQFVQQYTKYVIGRKVTENTELFSEDQIKSGFLLIKNASILRIITKWCSQLWQKFDNQTYFLDRIEGLGLTVGKKITIVYPWLKDLLTDQMKKEKQNILNFMKQIEDTNYSQQIHLMKNQLDNQSEEHIEKYEKIAGKFACKVVKNVQNFIVIYLNRLIHGLATVSKICFQQMSPYIDYWPYPFHLLSFKIGDLMRCKYSSKQRQVLKIFQRIQKINDENPQKLKIIRIKNRLKLGTNDILINIKFNDGLTCQIQLAVNSVQSQFSRFSCSINHFIYQLERSLFGPISQSCSIWKNFQKRSQQFEKLIQRECIKREKQLEKSSQCQRNKRSHSLISYYKPFICSQCSKHHYHSNYMVNHSICSSCQYWKCATCLINQNKQSKSKQFFIKDHELRKLCNFWQDQKSIPNDGVCIFIQKYPLEVINYKKIQYGQKHYLFKKTDSSFSLIQILSGVKQFKRFIKKCIIFSINDQSGLYSLSLDQKTARTKFIIPNYVQKCLKQEKQTISILRQQLSQIDMSIIKKASKQNMKSIKYIEFSACKITNLDLLSLDFINLNCINLNLNSVKDISKITKFSKLQRLYLNENQIQYIPSDISLLKNLKEFDIFGNKIKELPSTFAELKQLVIFNVGNNRLESFPSNFHKLQSLKQLIAKINRFNVFPQSLCRHSKLQNVNLAQNNIHQMPQQIEDLSQLKQMILDKNYITHLPLKMTKMTNLQSLKLDFNRIQSLNGIVDCIKLKQLVLSNNSIQKIEFPQKISNLKSLQFIDLGINLISGLNQSFKNVNQIKRLSLKQNKLEKVSEEIAMLFNLEQLQLQKNEIKQISPQMRQLKKLSKLNLQQNLLQFIPNALIMVGLTQLTLNYNRLKEIPSAIFNFPLLQKLEIKSLTNQNKYRINEIPESIQNLKNLTHLDLEGNTVVKISESIAKLPKLQTLKLNKNEMTIVSQCIFQIENLVCLELQENMLQEFNHEQKLNHLKKLHTINLRNNPIKAFNCGRQNNSRINFQVDTDRNLSELGEFSEFSELSEQNTKCQQTQQIKLTELSTLSGSDKQCEHHEQIKFSESNTFSELKKQSEQQEQIKLIQSNQLIKSGRQSGRQCEQHEQMRLNEQNTLMESGKICEQPEHIRLIESNMLSELSKQSKQYEQSKLPESNQQIEASKLTELKKQNGSSELIKLNYSTKQYQSSRQRELSELEIINAEDLTPTQNNSIIAHMYTELRQITFNLNIVPSYANNIQIVNFTRNKLQVFPQIIFHFKKLKQLHLQNNELSILSNNFQNKLILLQFLNLNSNKITQLSESIGELQSLVILTVSQNQLKYLPKSIGQLKKLKTLTINSNKIQYLPDQIGDLTQLQELNAAQNALKQIPKTIGLLRNLSSLFMFKNCISQVPESIGDCQKLKELYLNSNKIQQISLKICQNQNIEKLLLSQNQIKKIPKQINKMIGLMSNQLHLQNNPIEYAEDYEFLYEKGNKNTRLLLQNWKQANNKNILENVTNLNNKKVLNRLKDNISNSQNRWYHGQKISISQLKPYKSKLKENIDHSLM